MYCDAVEWITAVHAFWHRRKRTYVKEVIGTIIICVYMGNWLTHVHEDDVDVTTLPHLHG